MTQVLSNTTSPAIHNAITTILERAMLDGVYASSTPNGSNVNNGSTPSLAGYAVGVDADGANRGSRSRLSTPLPGDKPIRALTLPLGDLSGMALLEDIGMRGLGDMSFAVGKPER
jgi:hypothetical protein